MAGRFCGFTLVVITAQCMDYGNLHDRRRGQYLTNIKRNH
jgi:hypothetical protein